MSVVNTYKNNKRLTKEQLVSELFKLRQRVTELEVGESKHKQLERSLRESEKRYRTLYESAVEGILVVDIETREFKYANSAACTMLGYSKKEIKKLHVRDIHPKEFFGQIATEMEAQLKGKKTIVANIPCKRKDGTIIYVNISSTAVTIDGKECTAAFLRDVTDRKHAEEALQKSEERYRSLFEDSPISLWEDDCSGLQNYLDDLRNSGVKDFRTYFNAHPEVVAKCATLVKMVDVNKATFDLFDARTKKELIGGLDKIFIEESYSIFRETLIAFAEGQSEYEGESVIQTSSGEKRYYTLKWSVSPGYKESRTKVLVSLIDITKRKQAEEQLKDSQEKLRNLAAHLQTVREEERNRIAREIHDELGQVLTALKMDLNWLGKRLLVSQKALLGKTRSMLDLVDITIQTVKRISTELRPRLLDDLGLIAAIEWEAGEFENRTGIRCENDLIFEDTILSQDCATVIFRILQETLTNIARHANATEVKISLKEHDGNLVLRVEDNGKGIKEEEICDPKSFGLIGIRERAHYLGGKVIIRGIQNEGTTVVVSIPLDSEGENQC